jgi:hypothetical protein
MNKCEMYRVRVSGSATLGRKECSLYFNDLPTFKQVHEAYRDKTEETLSGADTDIQLKPGRNELNWMMWIDVEVETLFIVQPMWVDQTPPPKVSKPVVKGKRVVNTRTLMNTIIDVMACADESINVNTICELVLNTGYRTTAARFGNAVRVQLYRLEEDKMVVLDLSATYSNSNFWKLTNKGKLHWKQMIFGEFNKFGIKDVLTSSVKDIAAGAHLDFKEGALSVLHDALEEADAGEQILAWSLHKNYGRLLCEWIALPVLHR